MGRKPKYKTSAEMQAKIDEYFKTCEGHTPTDENGKVIRDKNGLPVIVGACPPTITGLALALGFKTRQSLLDYQASSPAFNDIITVAKSRVEAYTEGRLFDRDGVNGAKFSLQNNFRGWREKPAEEKSDENEIRIVDDI